VFVAEIWSRFCSAPGEVGCGPPPRDVGKPGRDKVKGVLLGKVQREVTCYQAASEACATITPPSPVVNQTARAAQ
jgi:hypothetical protein